MANDDKNLNIGINIQTTKSGGDPAQEIKKLTDESKRYEETLKKLAQAETKDADALRDLIAERKAAKAATVGALTASADLAKTTNELEGNVVKATAKQKDFTVATRGLGMAMRFLPGPVKEVAMALRLLFTNPVVAFFVLGAGAVKLFADQLKRLHDDARTVELLKGMSTSINEAREAVKQAVQPWNDYTTAMKNAAAAASDVDSQTKDAIADIELTAQLKEREADAQDNLAKSKLKARHAAGEITDEQFAKESADMDSRIEGRKSDRDAGTAAAVIAAKEAGLLAARSRTGKLSGDVSSTAERRATLEAAIKTATDDVAALREKDKAGNLTAGERGLLTQRSAALASAQYDLPGAISAEAAAGRAFGANNNAIAQFERDLPRDRSRAAAMAASSATVNGINRESRGPLGMVGRAAVAATGWSRGQGATGDDTAAFDQLMSELQVANQQRGQLIQALREILADGTVTKEEVEALRRQFSNSRRP